MGRRGPGWRLAANRLDYSGPEPDQHGRSGVLHFGMAMGRRKAFNRCIQPSGSDRRLLSMTQSPFATVLVTALLCAAPAYAQGDDYARQVAQERRQAEFEAPQLAEWR